MLFTATLIAISIVGTGLFMVRSGRLRPTLDTLPAPLGRLVQTVNSWKASAYLRQITWPHIRWWMVAELGALALWSMWVGRFLLDFSPGSWPPGREFTMATQSHIVWTWFRECGTCVLWNGSINGGNPAFVDLHGAVTHPLVVLTTLIWGYIVGSKIALVICLLISGVAQWWLALLLRIGTVPRLWSASLAIVGGHLAGRLEIGVFAVVLSTACGSLAMVAGVALAMDGRRRSAVLFGITLALTLLAGQGYIQLGLLAIMPAFALLLFDRQLQLRSAWREFAFAFLLAGLLSGIFLVPLVHFWPNISKDFDPYFASSQPLEYVPLNLVIRDVSFYTSEALQKQPYPYLYVNYIGWFPLLIALVAVRRAPRRLLLFFLISIGMIYITSSGIPFKILLAVAPLYAASVRNPPLIAGLAVPLILGLAALGLDTIITYPLPKLELRTVEGSRIGFSISWLFLVLAFWAIKPVYDFGQTWLHVERPLPAIAASTRHLVASDLRWVQVPFGEGFWLPPAFDAHLKLADAVRPWNWTDRNKPAPSLSLTRNAEDAAQGKLVETLDDLTVVAYPDIHYAAVEQEGTPVPCVAHGLGGAIDVDCDVPSAGSLVVQENAWSGWTATVDGAPLALVDDQWLRVNAPAGAHHFTFRYQPWDVFVGLLLSLTGIGLALWNWFRPRQLDLDPVTYSLVTSD